MRTRTVCFSTTQLPRLPRDPFPLHRPAPGALAKTPASLGRTLAGLAAYLCCGPGLTCFWQCGPAPRRGPRPHVHLAPPALSSQATPVGSLSPHNGSPCPSHPSTAALLARARLSRPSSALWCGSDARTSTEWEPRPGPGASGCSLCDAITASAMAPPSGRLCSCPVLMRLSPRPRVEGRTEPACERPRQGLTAFAVLQHLACAARPWALRGLGRPLGHLVLGVRDLDGELLPADGLAQGPDGGLQALLRPLPRAVCSAGVCGVGGARHSQPPRAASSPRRLLRRALRWPGLGLERILAVAWATAPRPRPSARWGDRGSQRDAPLEATGRSAQKPGPRRCTAPPPRHSAPTAPPCRSDTLAAAAGPGNMSSTQGRSWPGPCPPCQPRPPGRRHSPRTPLSGRPAVLTASRPSRSPRPLRLCPVCSLCLKVVPRHLVYLVNFDFKS